MEFSYNKEEHLKSRKEIALLIEKGFSFLIYPIKVRWIIVTDQFSPIKCAFGVPKRNFKKAVDRNRIKRLMKEAYRLNKSRLTNHLIEKNVKIQILFTFIDTTLPDYKKVESKIILTLQSLINRNEKSTDRLSDNSDKSL